MWYYQDKEYGKLDLLNANRIADLHIFQFSKTAINDRVKYQELYQIWQKVAKDLRKIKLEESLNNPHALQIFQYNMMSSSLEKYVDLNQSPAMEGKKLHKVMDIFMDWERDWQKEI